MAQSLPGKGLVVTNQPTGRHRKHEGGDAHRDHRPNADEGPPVAGEAPNTVGHVTARGQQDQEAGGDEFTLGW